MHWHRGLLLTQPARHVKSSCQYTSSWANGKCVTAVAAAAAATRYSHIGPILVWCCLLFPHGQVFISQVSAACLPDVVIVAVQIVHCTPVQVALPAACKTQQYMLSGPKHFWLNLTLSGFNQTALCSTNHALRAGRLAQYPAAAAPMHQLGADAGTIPNVTLGLQLNPIY